MVVCFTVMNCLSVDPWVYQVLIEITLLRAYIIIITKRELILVNYYFASCKLAYDLGMVSLWGDPVPIEMSLYRELPVLLWLLSLLVIFLELWYWRCYRVLHFIYNVTIWWQIWTFNIIWREIKSQQRNVEIGRITVNFLIRSVHL